MSVKRRWNKGIIIAITAVMCCLLPLPCPADEGPAGDPAPAAPADTGGGGDSGGGAPAADPSGGGVPAADPSGGGAPAADPSGGGAPAADPSGGGAPAADPSGGGTPAADPSGGGAPAADPSGGGTPAAEPSGGNDAGGGGSETAPAAPDPQNADPGSSGSPSGEPAPAGKETAPAAEPEKPAPEPTAAPEAPTPTPAASAKPAGTTYIPPSWYRSSSSKSASAAKEIKIRPVVLSEETENCLESLDSMRSPVAAAVSQEAEIEILGDWKLSADHEARLKALLAETKKKGFHVGIVMIDIHSGKGITVHGKREFYSASSIKGPYIVSLAAMYPKTVKTRMDTFRAIAVNSDNAAYSSLVNQFGRKYYNAWRKAADADAPLDRGHYASVSAEALTRLWLLNYQYFTTNRRNGWPMGELFERPNRSAIRPVLGGRYKTQTKAGWIDMNSKAASDAGIVYVEGDPYILSLVSDYRGTLERLEPYVELMDEIHAEITGRTIVPFR